MDHNTHLLAIINSFNQEEYETALQAAKDLIDWLDRHDDPVLPWVLSWEHKAGFFEIMKDIAYNEGRPKPCTHSILDNLHSFVLTMRNWGVE